MSEPVKLERAIFTLDHGLADAYPPGPVRMRMRWADKTVIVEGVARQAESGEQVIDVTGVTDASEGQAGR